VIVSCEVNMLETQIVKIKLNYIGFSGKVWCRGV
jgi:hypothetical protein